MVGGGRRLKSHVGPTPALKEEEGWQFILGLLASCCPGWVPHQMLAVHIVLAQCPCGLSWVWNLPESLGGVWALDQAVARGGEFRAASVDAGGRPHTWGLQPSLLLLHVPQGPGAISAALASPLRQAPVSKDCADVDRTGLHGTLSGRRPN